MRQLLIVMGLLCGVPQLVGNVHKEKCIEGIIKANRGVRGYPLKRVIETIRADDADEIPKVLGAGKRFMEKGIRYQLMHNGVKVHEHCYYGAWMTDIIEALQGHHEPQEEKAFHEVLKCLPEGATMMELGGYWCYYSMWFAKVVPNACNYIIEPLLENLEMGKKNFLLNDLTAVFHLGYLGNQQDPSFKGAMRINIDQFLKEKEIDHLEILHSDIQGAEHDMLLTCSEALKLRKIDYFFISTHSQKLHKLCRNLLLDADYKIIAEHGMEESCSCDGLIVARRKEIEGPERIDIKKYRH